METLASKTKTKTFKDVQIVKQGDKLILPKGMTYKQAHEELTRQEAAEEKVVAVRDNIQCFPLDGIVALMRAIKEVFGFTSFQDTPGFFGAKNPPVMLQVPTKDGFETAPMGRIAPLGWEEGFIQTAPGAGGECDLTIVGQIKKKFEPRLKEIITLTRKFLKEDSIYKGQAISVDMSYIDEGRDAFGDGSYDPMKDAPQFFPVDIEESQLILEPKVHFKLATNIWMLIEQTQNCLDNNIPLKHGCILGGPYGTGKTLTAKVTGAKCVANSWTFIYVKAARHLPQILRMAALYSPAVVFCEDADETTGGNRDAVLNNLLNTLSGVDTKSNPVITILTTNHLESITPALLRAERIDTVIEMKEPDAPTVKRFLLLYATDDDGHSLLHPDANLDGVAEMMAGKFVPAFIAEAVQKAKRYTIHRTKSPVIRGQITTEDLTMATADLIDHQKLAQRKHTDSDAETVAKSLANVFSYADPNDGGYISHRFNGK